MIRSFSIYLLVALFLCYEMALQVSPGVMTAQLMQSFNIDVFWLGVTSGSYFLTYTLMQIPAGLLFDKYPPRYIIIFPLLVCIIGGFFFAKADGFLMAIVGRVLMGAGSAFAFIGVLVVGNNIFSGKYFALLSGCTQMLAALGALSGAALIVPIVVNLGWRETLIVLNTLGVILLILLILFLRVPALVKQGEKRSTWADLKTVIQKKQNWWVALYACLLWVPMSVVASLFGVPFVESYLNFNHFQAANTVSMMWIGIAVGSPILGYIADKSGKLIYVLALSAGIGLFSFALILFAGVYNLWIVSILFFLAGVGCSGQALSFSQVNKNNGSKTKSTAIGFNNMAVVISGFIFQPLIGFIIRYSETYTQQNNYFMGMLLVLIAYLVAMVIALKAINP